MPGKPTWIGHALREPLVHFVVFGILVFGGYKLIDHQPQTAANPQRIEITEDDLRQLAVVWLAQGRQMPTLREMRALVDQKVTSEMLVREAMALGLDSNDEVIKRRLAQKMDFLIADVAALAAPSNEELETWFEANKSDFTKPPRLSFRHLYFSFDKRGADARDTAEASLARVAGRPPGALETANVADPFMFRDYYADVTPEQMAKEFGGAFTDALFQFQPGDWRGPIESGYGWHLIWIDSREAVRVPALEEIRPAVMQAWQAERYREVKQRAIDEIRSRYEVVVPPLDDLNFDDLTIVRSGQANPTPQ